MSTATLDIKPIETSYKGYKFRSRLEARWAVFFDAMGWQWEYEPEGYVLSDGSWYLPDFYVHHPHYPGYYEVKPFKKDMYDYDNAMNKLHRLCVDTHKRCILLNGLPEFKSYKMLVPVYQALFNDCDVPDFDPYEKNEDGTYEYSHPEYWFNDKGDWTLRTTADFGLILDDTFFFNQKNIYNIISGENYVDVNDKGDYIEYDDEDYWLSPNRPTSKWIVTFYMPAKYSKKYRDAVNLAKSARFEYGAKG